LLARNILMSRAEGMWISAAYASVTYATPFT